MKDNLLKMQTKGAAGRTSLGLYAEGWLACGLSVMTVIVLVWGFAGSALAAADGSILDRFGTIKMVASTVPGNGDVNPYGVAEVMHTKGHLIKGHILVSNFNNSSNLQGTGSTIVDVAPSGEMTLFSQLTASTLPGPCPGGIGLTTALVVLRSGWVIVGSLPTTDGTAATAQAGCLIVLDSMGTPVETISGALINGPWDMTAFEVGHEAKLFVTNVLNGTVAAGGQVVNEGTVVRIDMDLRREHMPLIESLTVIGDGFAERTDPAALVIGPTGVGLRGSWNAGIGEASVLYVADSLNNRIQAIEHPLSRTDSAGIGTTLSASGSLNDPLGLFVAPGGHILVVNGNDGLVTEITLRGDQIASKTLDSTGSPAGAGTLFGLGFLPMAGVYFVDDGTNTLNLFHK